MTLFQLLTLHSSIIWLPLLGLYSRSVSLLPMPTWLLAIHTWDTGKAVENDLFYFYPNFLKQWDECPESPVWYYFQLTVYNFFDYLLTVFQNLGCSRCQPESCTVFLGHGKSTKVIRKQWTITWVLYWIIFSRTWLHFQRSTVLYHSWEGLFQAWRNGRSMRCLKMACQYKAENCF